MAEPGMAFLGGGLPVSRSAPARGTAGTTSVQVANVRRGRPVLGLGKRHAVAAASFAAGLAAARARRGSSACRAEAGEGRQTTAPTSPALVGLALATMVMLVSGPAFAEDAAKVRQATEYLPLEFGWDGFVSLNANLVILIDNTLGSVGVALILYTIITKLLLWPFNQSASQTSALMRLLQPQVNAIQAQYANDEKRKGMMVQALYKDNDVNPIGSLATTFGQLPVFFALFAAIKKLASEDDHFKEPFLWIPSLAGPSDNNGLDWLLKSKSASGFEPLVGWQDAGLYLIFPVVLVVAQLALTQFTSLKKEPDTLQLVFPAILGISLLVSPQGLGIYWLTNSVLTAAQTQLARSEVKEKYPQLQEVFESEEEFPPLKMYDTVTLNGQSGVICYGPDTDNDCKVRFEDDTESRLVRATALRRPGSKLDEVLAELEERMGPTGSGITGGGVPPGAAVTSGGATTKQQVKAQKRAEYRAKSGRGKKRSKSRGRR